MILVQFGSYFRLTHYQLKLYNKILSFKDTKPSPSVFQPTFGGLWEYISTTTKKQRDHVITSCDQRKRRWILGSCDFVWMTLFCDWDLASELYWLNVMTRLEKMNIVWSPATKNSSYSNVFKMVQVRSEGILVDKWKYTKHYLRENLADAKTIKTFGKYLIIKIYLSQRDS